MLSKRYRLPTPLIRAFPGKKYPGRTLMVLAEPSTLEGDRLACVISKKVFANAVSRNALKRLIHETLRPFVDLPPHFDYLIIAHPTKTPTPQANYANDLLTIIKSLKIPSHA